MKQLDRINEPKDIKDLNLKEKAELAEEIREFLIKSVSKTGGHLASNLGIVEVTIALFSCYDLPRDKFVWDVGHQAYIHKILTGRKDKFNTLRQFGGISGFPKSEESIYDTFNTGHSSTSISAGLGIKRACEIQGIDNEVVAIIGDGALTGGLAYESINDGGYRKDKITIILNDNKVSISESVGATANLLDERKKIGSPKEFFENLGYVYIGPIDGHNIKKLEEAIKASKRINEPVVIHVKTVKGKGYKKAEEDPTYFHGVGTLENKEPKKIFVKTYSHAFGEALEKIAGKDENVVVITPAMQDGTEINSFAEKFPERFFDVGIAEEHSLCLAAGMAKQGLKPVVVSYSSFFQRGYDQFVHDIALQNLGVTICLDRAGVVGADGETHQGLFDMSFLATIPNMVIMAPRSHKELEDMLAFAVNLKRPVAIRYPKGTEELKIKQVCKIEFRRAEKLTIGKDVTIVTIGKMALRAYEVAERLRKIGIDAEVINARFLKPLDEDMIIESVRKTKKVVTIEDNIIYGGLRSMVLDSLYKNELNNVLVKSFGYPDEFIKQGSVAELERKYGLDEDSIYNAIKEM